MGSDFGWLKDSIKDAKIENLERENTILKKIIAAYQRVCPISVAELGIDLKGREGDN